MGTSKNKNQLLELVVKNLGVIEDASIVFGEGMTAITGETGAGKTLLVTALQLLSGGRSDSSLVGIFGEEATIEGRFICDEDELNLKTSNPEFIEWKWLDIENLPGVIVEFKRKVYEDLLPKIRNTIN